MARDRFAAVLCFALITPCVPLLSAHADDWPENGLGVCTDAGDQGLTAAVADGAGGAIVIWFDYRSGMGADIYAQHVLATGVVDPAWTANGTPLCIADGDQQSLAAISDGAGGAIVTWQDNRGGSNSDIYAQRVLASGAIAPGWTANGTLLCDAANDQLNPTLATDGANGAIVTWADDRNAGDNDIYAQHVLASGSVDANWTANGTLLCNANNVQSYPTIVSDGAGGAIVTWQDPRIDAADVYAQRVLASGIVDGTWTPNGTIVCDAMNSQGLPQIVSDGAAGAIITWQDLRGGATSDIYAQRLLAAGTVDPSWTANGALLCDAANNQLTPQIVPAGVGTAIVIWRDFRGGVSSDLYAQRVLAAGTVDPGWTANGTLICNAANNQLAPVVVSDGSNGAIIAWADERSGTNADIYAQRVLAAGTVDPGWTANGNLLCDASNNQSFPSIASNGASGAIVAWSDNRQFGNSDIFAQRVTFNGRTPALVSLVRTIADERHVLVEWLVSDGAGRASTVWRRTEGSAWQLLSSVTADPSGRLVIDDRDVEPGTRYGYRLGVDHQGRNSWLGETWVDVPSGAVLSLHGLRPNPSLHDVVVSFSLPRRESATLELFDANGRRVASHGLESPDPGNHIVNFGGRRNFASGAYLLRLTQGGRSVTAKAVILR